MDFSNARTSSPLSATALAVSGLKFWVSCFGFQVSGSRIGEEGPDWSGCALFHTSPRAVPAITLRLNVPAKRKIDVSLLGKGNSNSHGARPVHRIITMIVDSDQQVVNKELSFCVMSERCLRCCALRSIPDPGVPRS